MKKHKVLILCLFLISFFLLGCNEKKSEVFIKPELNIYTQTMSSVPGIPLIAEFKTKEKNMEIKYHWTAEEGIFLNWEQSSGKISVLGKDFKNNGERIYWSVDNNKIKKSSFKIYLKAEESNSSKILAETSIEIEQSKEGFFTIKEKRI